MSIQVSFVAALILSCCPKLTHTPDITSGHGWALVNVGLTMAIAILVVKSVFSEKSVFSKNEGGYPFLVLDSTYYPYLALF